MTVQKARRIGIITATIIVTVQVMVVMLLFYFFIGSKIEETPLLFVPADTSLFKLWDIAIPITMIVTIFNSRNIGEEIILKKEDNEPKRVGLITVSTTISCVLTLLIKYSLAIWGFYLESGDVFELILLFLFLILCTVTINVFISSITNVTLYGSK